MTFDYSPSLTGRVVEVRPLTGADFWELYAVAADPLLWAQHPEPERARLPDFRRFFDTALDQCALAVRDRRTGALIGSSRFANHRPDTRTVEIGWTFLARSHWGGPCNADLKDVMLRHAFNFVDRVVFLVHPANLRSQRALEKIGAVLLGTTLEEERKPYLEFEILSDGYAELATVA